MTGAFSVNTVKPSLSGMLVGSALFLIGLTAVTPIPCAAAVTNACIACHTSDSIMKSMVKPPELGGEGEG